ncbi:hypothetical protein BEN74_01630 [Acinetobacter sp. WCHAc010034]|uniref:leucine-rich repeat protein n=1 Tax=Acinetobacter sp. WCHAc010034 TaxID=1879049 RepID=UPI000A397569|nr:leucine-rich repeat protein [Acinetobacter sp. WCHAc010034]AYA01709.1 hypothetical protein BEN74_01630 [Acinetobacter sp. WCHAc010034]
MNTTKILGEAVGIQRQDIIDRTEEQIAEGLTGAVILGRFKRGRVDAPMAIHQGNIRGQLGHDPKNPDYIAVQDCLDTGVPSVQVLRLGQNEEDSGEDRFVISCTPPDGQQQIILNKVRNTLPFLTFRNITFDIYINGTLAASDVLMLDEDAMDSVGLQVEDLTGNGRQISIKNKTDERRAFELFPVEEPNFARDTDIELGHVVVEKYSFHFCLAAAANDLPTTIEWKIEGDGTLYSDRVVDVTESSKRNLNITELLTYNGLEIISAQAFLQNKITSLTIADTVWLIGQNSFTGNKITDLVLGSGLKRLGNYAFKDNAISAVTVHAIIPPEFESDSWLPFDGNPIASIRVPAESVNAYKAAEGWSNFSSMITAI